MMLKLLVILIFLSVMVASGKKLSCFNCKTNTSWADCDKTGNEVTCIGPSIQCLSIFYTKIDKATNEKTQTFYKGCKSDCTKSAMPECRSDARTKSSCDLKCCSTANCNINRGKGTVLSASLSVTGQLVIAGTMAAYLSKMM